ncbi:hypothetical protein, partial [Plantactinospora mayteni]|uniref:hypothetical protein n=1 Tax=Plantactinospora mayteni TaxID=566021 RepID=UPI001944CD09
SRRVDTRRLLLATVALVATIMGSTAVSTPAHAAYPQTPFREQDLNLSGTSGKFIWYNRSVQVGGGVTGSGNRDCAAVVFTAYDSNNRQVARAARPGDNQYNCTNQRYGFGFMLDASNVVGGIRSIRVDLYIWNIETGQVFLEDSGRYPRP